MPKKDNRVDAYIAKSAPFAKPILEHIRALVHRVCPDCEEKIKWGFPHFDYHGEMMCSMAAFKEHAAFSFWKASLLTDPKKVLNRVDAMGAFGKLTSIKDLPSDAAMTNFLRQAMKMNEEGKKVAKPKAAPVVVKPPDYLLKALKKNAKARKTFEAFSLSNQREYVNWLLEAKTDETRDKRLTTAIEWMAEGKPRNWKYMKK